MNLLIRFNVGVIVEAVVLAEAKDRMRVAVEGYPDTLELMQAGSQWLTEAAEPVEFDFFMAPACVAETKSDSQQDRLALAAAY